MTTHKDIDIEEAKEIRLSEIALLKKEVKNLKIQNEVLEGKLKASNVEVLHQKAHLKKVKLGLESFIFNMDVATKKKPKSKIREIQDKVCVYFLIGYREFISHRRYKRLVRPRHIAMYLCKKDGFSYPDIGEAFNRDHTTIVNGVKNIEEQLKTDENLNRIIEEVK